MRDMPWIDVEPLPHVNGDLESVLASVASLKRAWTVVVSSNSESFREARRRSLRRHAIETGIIERLYDVEWGVTEALVAEGITAEAVATSSNGAIGEDVLELIRSQYDALTFLAEVAREGRDISISLVKELHVALTRLQKTYTATGPGGLRFEATLHHGQWKQQPNHVTRPDGSVLQYTPPDQVQPQMETLIELYNQTAERDPVVRGAWFHHRFVRIHPFEDGNGRVARCLTLLTLLRGNLAPLVIDRRERDRYLRCLDSANEGDLRPLSRFFAELEIVALRSELERPVEELAGQTTGGALAVLDAHISRLRGLRDEAGAGERANKIEALASGVQARVSAWLEQIGQAIQSRYKELDPDAFYTCMSATPPDPKSYWWRRQVVRTARSVDFYANIGQGVWWTHLRLSVLGQKLRYLAFLQKVGHGETGVLTLTVYAEVLSEAGEEAREIAEEILVSSPTESVTWTFEDNPETHWNSVVELLDESMVAALDRFSASLS